MKRTFNYTGRKKIERRDVSITIREERIETVTREELQALSRRWIGGKKVSDREIWIYARRVVYEHESSGFLSRYQFLAREG